MNCDCDGEQADVYTEKEVRGRKHYKCCECNGLIKKGEGHIYIAMLYDGSWSKYRQCQDCRFVINEIGRTIYAECGSWCYGVQGVTEGMRVELENLTGEELEQMKRIAHMYNASADARGGSPVYIQKDED